MGNLTRNDVTWNKIVRSRSQLERTQTAPVHHTSVQSSKVGRSMLQVLGVLAVGACFLVNIVDPYSGVVASQYFTVTLSNTENLPTQSLSASGVAGTTVVRDNYGVVAPPPPPPPPAPTPTATPAAPSSGSESESSGWAPPAGAPDPGSAQAIAFDAVAARGWGVEQYDCLVSLWNRESGWRYNAYNAGSGAYGIPQSLPGSKMASAGADWETNPATQIAWGLGYIAGRYDNPCGAWAASESKGWY